MPPDIWRNHREHDFDWKIKTHKSPATAIKYDCSEAEIIDLGVCVLKHKE